MTDAAVLCAFNDVSARSAVDERLVNLARLKCCKVHLRRSRNPRLGRMSMTQPVHWLRRTHILFKIRGVGLYTWLFINLCTIISIGTTVYTLLNRLRPIRMITYQKKDMTVSLLKKKTTPTSSISRSIPFLGGIPKSPTSAIAKRLSVWMSAVTHLTLILFCNMSEILQVSC